MSLLDIQCDKLSTVIVPTSQIQASNCHISVSYSPSEGTVGPVEMVLFCERQKEIEVEEIGNVVRRK